jgi:hypothetical protein
MGRTSSSHPGREAHEYAPFGVLQHRRHHLHGCCTRDRRQPRPGNRAHLIQRPVGQGLPPHRKKKINTKNRA